MIRFFLTINRFFYRKNRTGKLRVLSLFVSNIRLYYVNAVRFVSEGSVVRLFSQRDRSGALRGKEIKNEPGCITNEVSERRSRTKVYGTPIQGEIINVYFGRAVIEIKNGEIYELKPFKRIFRSLRNPQNKDGQ
mgnify:CR=1 FL=1